MLPKFELYMPDTMEEACRLKAEGAEVVAGGTDVFVNMHGGKGPLRQGGGHQEHSHPAGTYL